MILGQILGCVGYFFVLGMINKKYSQRRRDYLLPEMAAVEAEEDTAAVEAEETGAVPAEETAAFPAEETGAVPEEETAAVPRAACFATESTKRLLVLL